MTATGSSVQMECVGPERPGGQGLDHHQEESGNLAIWKLLTSDDGRAWTDFVATARQGRDGGWSYEAWSVRGMVRWVRSYGNNGGYSYQVVEVLGENPIERQDPTALSTLEEELAAGADPSNPQRAFVGPDSLTYPYAYERISQLFDSPNAPDLVVNPKSYTYGRQPGQHGALDVIQSRSPLVFCGPGVRTGEVEAFARQVDIAPTIARLMGFPLIDGKDSSGRTSSARGVGPDVYFKRQDGRVLEEVLDGSGKRPERVCILLLDGQSHTELRHRLATEPEAIPSLRRLIGRGVMLRWGSITNFPSITWPSHNAIGTSCWSGHHDIVNPTYYLRATRETVSPQGQQFDTGRFLNTGVETIYEAFHRVYGEWDGAFTGALTASVNEPCTRGADHASLERQLVGDRGELIVLTKETEHEISPRWFNELEEQGHKLMGQIDNRALAQGRQLYRDKTHAAPKLMYFEFSQPDAAAHDYGPHHEGARQALDETDVRIGHLLREIEEAGLLEETLFVVTTDHGMAVQDISLLANPARIPQRDGMEAVTTEPFVYLRDIDVAIEVAPDGRTAQVTVLDNDPDGRGEKLPVAGAEIVVMDHRDGLVARARTDGMGNAGVSLPAELRPSEMHAAVRAEGFNSRHLRLDGENLVVNLRRVLYGAGQTQDGSATPREG